VVRQVLHVVQRIVVGHHHVLVIVLTNKHVHGHE
jgi:hypothetical protein